MTERRQARRYDLVLPAVVNPNSEERESGRTRDISTGGVFLLVPQTINRECDFEVNIDLPTETGVQIQAVARAVRTEEWTQRGRRVVGVGAVIQSHEIVRSPGKW